MKLLGVILGVALLQCTMGHDDPMENPNLFEGDMELTPEQLLKIGGKDSLVYGSSTHPSWPKVIPYSIDASLQRQSRAMSAIRAAISDYESKTCLRFKQRSNENGYIYFQPGGGCSSPVGYYGRRNGITLASGCWHKGIVIHEIMHSLGFYHEQSRPDRDNYVTINWSNIKSSMKFNFNKYDTGKIQSGGSPYDLSSIMHYGNYAFAVNRRIKTITAKNGGAIGQRAGFSSHDVDQLNKRYCGGSCPNSHRYAYYNGEYCCKTNKEKIYRPQGALCDGSKLSITSLCCEGNKLLKCKQHPCSNSPSAKSGVDGGFSVWKAVGCTKSCGGGEKKFTRTCTNPKPKYNGKECVGQTSKTEGSCNKEPCPIDGGFSVWKEVGCTKSCGGGEKQFTRTCTNPKPKYNGKQCVGQTSKTEGRCKEQPCPTSCDDKNGSCKKWANLNPSECTKNPGFMLVNCCKSCKALCVSDKNKFCKIWASNNPSECTENPGYMLVNCCKSCKGKPVKPVKPVKVHGSWGTWNTWNACSKSCGKGMQFRTRLCNGGNSCFGQRISAQNCYDGPCPASCDDKHGSCKKWANLNQCTTNPGYMLVNCCKSCKALCACDKNRGCKIWASRNPSECTTNPGFMLVNCSKSCKAAGY